MLPHRFLAVSLAALYAGLLYGCGPSSTSEPPRATVSELASATTAVAIPPSVATASGAVPTAEPASPPADVIAFRKERDQCDHFRGEEPYGAKRAAELAAQLDEFCKGTDARLAGLRKKYGAQPDVLRALKNYEDQIE